VAGPYQKAAAIRSAEGAVRPWSAYAGLGERRGAQFAAVMADLATSPDDAPTRFQPPHQEYAHAVSSSAQQVSDGWDTELPDGGQASQPPVFTLSRLRSS
jgi:hypothetical protein